MSLLDAITRIFARRPRPQLVVDSDGCAWSLAGAETQRIRWETLREVAIVTTSQGPFVEDVFFVLRDDRSLFEIPHGAVGESGLLDRLFALPGFDAMTMITAMGSTDDAVFRCWTAEPTPEATPA